MATQTQSEKMYMNIFTGEVDTRDGWWYEDEDGHTSNAVDFGEVLEVELVDGQWVEVE
jgi:hypothetical protein